MSGAIRDTILEVEDLRRHFDLSGRMPWSRSRKVKAVDGISLHLDRGETLGLVGESGCGKSTLARLILLLLSPTSGRIVFQGREVSGLDPKERQGLRLRLQMIFQDSLGSLDPRMSVGRQLLEPLGVHGIGRPSSRLIKILSVLKKVGLRADTMDKYPHQLSGGQRQRVVLARALALEPSLLVCDEPVSALDVSIQARAVNLLQEIQRKTGLTYLFISHDLRVVRHISHRVAIMYLGRLVEVAPAKTIFGSALHPYTRALISAVPLPDPGLKRTRELLAGEPPDPVDRPPGCAFHPRCRFRMPVCEREEPPLEVIRGKHRAACHLALNDQPSLLREEYRKVGS